MDENGYEVRRQETKPTKYLTRFFPFHYLNRQIPIHPFWGVMGLLFILVTFGTSGYMIIEGWSLLDALYMTIITMTTIGYAEVKLLSSAGRIFTIGLIVIGVITTT